MLNILYYSTLPICCNSLTFSTTKYFLKNINFVTILPKDSWKSMTWKSCKIFMWPGIERKTTTAQLASQRDSGSKRKYNK